MSKLYHGMLEIQTTSFCSSTHASKIQKASKYHWGENQKKKEQGGVGDAQGGMHTAKHLFSPSNPKQVPTTDLSKGIHEKENA